MSLQTLPARELPTSALGRRGGPPYSSFPLVAKGSRPEPHSFSAPTVLRLEFPREWAVGGLSSRGGVLTQTAAVVFIGFDGYKSSSSHAVWGPEVRV